MPQGVRDGSQRSMVHPMQMEESLYTIWRIKLIDSAPESSSQNNEGYKPLIIKQDH